MPQAIPSNSIRPLTVGEKVRILPKFQDPGDDEFDRIVIEAPANSLRVLIRTLIPDMTIQPTETIEAAKLERVIDLGPYGDMPPETVIEKHASNLLPEIRLWLVEKFPAKMMESGNPTPEEVDLCVQLHPGIALSRAVNLITDECILQLTENNSFQVLLYASDRLAPESLRKLTTTNPGECIIILERHPESQLHHSLRAILDDGINTNVAKALSITSTPAG